MIKAGDRVVHLVSSAKGFVTGVGRDHRGGSIAFVHMANEQQDR